MRVIKVDTIEIQVEEQTIINMRKCVTMDTQQEIFIRNKKEAGKIIKKYYSNF